VGYHLHLALIAAGLPRIRDHDLRHTAATLMVEEDIPVQVVPKILGHRSITTTLALYAHVTERLQREAVEKMDKLFRRQAQ
jgi:integrase